ncbi:hypothetical protein SOASR032_17050 [Pragia fontium]|uniref:Integrase n=1 Tax=Pragia fontium TaxID=82985 RepID=A0ABQ5LHR6_9GAMM|nr:hypothetical protein SOASR032_17050 [Pragia fontium]
MLDIPHRAPHDLSGTVRTVLLRLQCSNEVAKAILGHTKGGMREELSSLYVWC